MVCILISIYILIAINLPYNKNKLCEMLDYWSRDMLNFNFLEKGLGIVSPPHFVYDFSRKMFLMLDSIKWPNSIVWLPLLFKIHSFFYMHADKLGWSSICLRFSQFEPEIKLDGILNFKTHLMVWYCVWYEHCNGLF